MQSSATTLKMLVANISKIPLTGRLGGISAHFMRNYATKAEPAQGANSPLGPNGMPGESQQVHFILESHEPVSTEYIENNLSQWENKIDVAQLTDTEKGIHRAHLKAVKEGKEYYVDPVTGFQVFTILNHLRRAECCGNSCRHCPYEHINVPDRYKDLKKFNSSFYS